MTGRNPKDWLDFVASIAVAAGLVLVAYEVRQANIFAKAQTERDIGRTVRRQRRHS